MEALLGVLAVLAFGALSIGALIHEPALLWGPLFIGLTIALYSLRG